MEILDKLKMLPHSPGVYRFLDSSGTVIYVGKAKDLKARVSQYFRPNGLNRKTQVMVSKIADIHHTVVGSEADAFLLENNLIKQYQPRYNILLKDGKTYPWICLRNEKFPRVTVTRRFVKDGSRYFGPYSSAMHAHNLLALISTLYKLRTCNTPITDEGVAKGKYKVCLDYHLGKCAGPCAGRMSEAEYGAQIEAIVQILKGNSWSLIKEFERRMKERAAVLDFEEAQQWKEKMELLERHYAKSLIVNSKGINVDVFYVIVEGQDAFGSFLRVHDGGIVQSMNLELKLRIEEDGPAVLGSFISGIYEKLEEYEGQDEGHPSEIVVPFLPDMPEALPGVTFTVPEKGDRLALLELGRKNAAAIKFERLKHEEFVNPEEHSQRIVENLRKDLGMDVPPVHIECFDNSNIQGTNPVASCVVFRDGAPSKRDYRHFNIKTVVGANDFASMKEVVNRRYSRLLAEGQELPQLIVIDGGRGQVNAAYEALSELGLIGKVTLIGLAKRLEEIIVPGDPYPHFIDRNSTSLKVLMHIRDEAHRFGITHHRNRRSASSLVSELDNIPGVGAVSREKLVTKYKTLSRIKSAPYREIVNVIGKRSADSLFSWFGLDKS
ncbi:MAG TPA: excinuclease ABC subunit C [Candidatus Coprenecus pullicola]|jgi:excinuclease ABC subunit C|nr:excinuclease ABC subunit C [Candidatus Coprenecus pullicola]